VLSAEARWLDAITTTPGSSPELRWIERATSKVFRERKLQLLIYNQAHLLVTSLCGIGFRRDKNRVLDTRACRRDTQSYGTSCRFPQAKKYGPIKSCLNNTRFRFLICNVTFLQSESFQDPLSEKTRSVHHIYSYHWRTRPTSSKRTVTLRRRKVARRFNWYASRATSSGSRIADRYGIKIQFLCEDGKHRWSWTLPVRKQSRSALYPLANIAYSWRNSMSLRPESLPLCYSQVLTSY